ncbi:MAG: heavy-metal-associated domain-containing protein [Flavobacteriales bacterium]|nr:heavy-metal-associated domain-containing protein [Flavobacteriales bacterium]PIV92412.1 MAG: heavy metal transporter [Flavobacteriaceae bacterium CG17_big_fil_post_rev_8_21_14_2_50_33_15]PIY11810.1 MAG: heavy metal transporter [Flavobacteriaceae bacterium CG_4_10_14_3_um_filter_33_47]PJB16745.1 MAG: heavy metal transporter [Flavobacteriaceae bacterium CG_4_9_14_3_um_filter_33_16]NCP51656.1 heavy-metal-associated domain-containing protein [Flavobacteriales bacterium]
MNKLKRISVILMITLLTFNCKNKTNPEVKTIEVENSSEALKDINPNANYAKAEFTIDGMTCAIGCAKTIEKKIAGMDGVKSAIVDFDRKLAMVEYNDAKVNTSSLEETVTKIAEVYKVSNMKTVDDFSTITKECVAKCTPDCTKKDCPECKTKTDACKAKCASKTESEKMACAKDCQKSCCANNSKA